METTKHWSDIETNHQKAIIEVFSEKIKYKDQSRLARIFTLANPEITFPEDKKYFRIEEGSALLVVMKNYL